MLILTRRVGETVVIGREITINVVGVKGNQVRLGIDAPADVPVHRGEVSERMRIEASKPQSTADTDSRTNMDPTP